MEDNFVALDIGSSRVSAIMAKSSFGKIQVSAVTSSACDGVSKSVISNADKTKDAVLACKKKLESISGKTVNSAYISIPSGLCRVIKYKGTMFLSENKVSVSQQDIIDFVRKAKNLDVDEDDEIVDIIPTKVIIGNDNTSSHYSFGKHKVEVEAEVLTADKFVLIDLLKSVENAGIEIIRVIAAPLALDALISGDKDEGNTNAFVDIGSETIDISIVKDKNIYYNEIIPLGGNNITSDIANCLNITFEKAEKLKISQSGDSNVLVFDDEEEKPFNIDLLGEIVDARVEELISISIKSLKKSDKYNDIKDIYFTGRGIESYMESLKAYEDKLKKNIKVLKVNNSKVNSSIYYIPTGIVKFVGKEFEYEGDPLESSVSKDEVLKENKSFVSKIKHYFDDLFK
ncbi:cell division FtsA domain-containing protein [Clostridium oryzae]|uniref:Cell division protein FtsA n=1 Tax=Clostridium oryzae TaxID=1450648 RepID=A0A1V4I545_9CLOT|nr:cell division FtsA domain-containing protein [Clostridium oryzae]OPJ54725.1 cell division protein FtsA [Clostridium oryzae]